ncbi:MAG: Flp family type IVb pilin [Hyphomicrobiaceae bacterium]|nr:Flp family type IVb pilin [Hyphomicrobiaceae bacterium]
MLARPSDIRGFVRAFTLDERGATAIEYALIAAGIFLAIYLSIYNMTSSIKTMFETIKTEVISALA